MRDLMRFDAICDLSCALPEDPETLVAMCAFGISISATFCQICSPSVNPALTDTGT